MKVIVVLMRVSGIVLVVLGLVFLSPLADLLPLEISVRFLNPFESGPTSHYYRVVPVEHSVWVEAILIGLGAALIAASRYLRQRQ
jgi:succinate dehydrogenase hydrophobic anchor subunit